jgi:signal transduction histidine kinase
MKLKLVMITAISVFSLTAALLWLMDEKISEERQMALESGLRGPVNALSQALQADLRGLRRALPAGTALSRERQDWKSFRPFFALAQVRFDQNRPQILQFAADPRGVAESWGVDGASSLISGWPAQPAPENGSALFLQQDPKTKRRIFSVVLRDGERTWVAWAGTEFLQGILDLQKGPKGTLAILNSRGEILAHSTAEYAGTVAADGSIYQRMISDAGVRADKNFESSSKEVVFGSFEKVTSAGFTVMAFRPIAEMRAERRATLIYGALAGLGLFFLAASAIWSIASRWESKTEYSVKAAAQRAATATPMKSDAVVAALAAAPVSTKEKNEASMRVAAVLGHELRGPLASILGFCQMILSSSQDKQVTEPVDSILRETRAARDVVDKILAFSGETASEKKSARVETALAKVLKDYDQRFHQRHVKVIKEFRETAPLSLSLPGIESVLKHLLNNAIEAMDRMPKKEITLKLTEDVDSVQLIIRDNGEGMDDTQRMKIMEPFFTTRNTSLHMGLGLPAAAGILKEHGAQLKIESARGKGTTVTVIFPKPSKTVEINGQPVKLQTEQKVNIPKSVPASSKDKPSLRTLKIPASGEKTVDFSDLDVSGPKSSPADVDIEDLLSMPEEPARPENKPETKPSGKPVAKNAPLEFHTVINAPAAPQAAAQTNDDKTVVLPLTADAGPIVEGEKVTAPKFAPPKRSEKLDSVNVEVRRPGARLE